MKITFEQAITAHQGGRFEDAERLYQAVLKIQPNHPDASHNLGIIKASRNKMADALLLFKIAYEANTNIEQFYISYVNILINNKQFKEAEVISRKEIELKPDYTLAYRNLGVILFQLGKLKEAEKSYKKAIELKFDDAHMYINLAIISNELCKYQESEKYYKKSIELDPKLSVAYNNLGNLQKKLGKFIEADKNFKKSIELKPSSHAYNNLANLSFEQGKFEEAKLIYKKSIELEPADSVTYNNLGITLQKLMKFEESEKSYKKSIELKPNYAEAFNNLGNVQKELRSFDEAEKSYKKSIELKPNYAAAYSNLGTLLSDLKRFDEAEKNYKKSMELNPNLAETHYNLGCLSKNLSKFYQAEKSFRKTIELKPDFAEAHNELGILLNELGKLNDAELSSKKAIELKPDFFHAYNNLGNLLQQLGRSQESYANYKKAIEINPNFTHAKYNLGIMLHSVKKYKEASDILKLIDFKDSKKYLLKCRFELDDKPNFLKELDNLLKEGQIDAMLGSFCSRSEIKYGIKKLNPFCGNPLKYVLKTELNEKYDFKDTFIDGSANILNDKTVLRRSQGLLSKGYQTAGNLFSLDNNFIEKIKKIILLEIKRYQSHFKNSSEGFLKNWPTDFHLYGWLICMKSGGKLSSHMHEKGWVSGSVYINVPPKLKTDSGNLVVCIDDKKYETKTSQNTKKIINVNTGSLCLFPSSLHHYTIPFESEEERIVLAFDVIPKSLID